MSHKQAFARHSVRKRKVAPLTAIKAKESLVHDISYSITEDTIMPGLRLTYVLLDTIKDDIKIKLERL